MWSTFVSRFATGSVLVAASSAPLEELNSTNSQWIRFKASRKVSEAADTNLKRQPPFYNTSAP